MPRPPDSSNPNPTPVPTTTLDAEPPDAAVEPLSTGGAPEALAFVDVEPFAGDDAFTLAPGFHQLRVTDNDGYEGATPGPGLSLVTVDPPMVGSASVFDRESLLVEIPDDAVGQRYNFVYEVEDAEGIADRATVTIDVTVDGSAGSGDAPTDETAADVEVDNRPDVDAGGGLLGTVLPLLLLAALLGAVYLFVQKKKAAGPAGTEDAGDGLAATVDVPEMVAAGAPVAGAPGPVVGPGSTQPPPPTA